MVTWARLVRSLAFTGVLLSLPAICAVPVGYRYIGSRIVSDGHVVYWYWNIDTVEVGPYSVSFVARMFARAVDLNQERPYVAVIRCDSKTYREAGSQAAYQAIDDGDPIDNVWRAGCIEGRAASLVQRQALLSGRSAKEAASLAPVKAADPPVVVAAAPVPPPQAAPASPPATNADPRRVDQCIRFSDAKPSPVGDGTITNTCAFAIEVMLCYKGGGSGIYDCPAQAAKGKQSDSLGPNATRMLPEYRKARHKGIAAVACRGSPGAVFPRLDDAAGSSGCS